MWSSFVAPHPQHLKVQNLNNPSLQNGLKSLKVFGMRFSSVSLPTNGISLALLCGSTDPIANSDFIETFLLQDLAETGKQPFKSGNAGTPGERSALDIYNSRIAEQEQQPEQSGSIYSFWKNSKRSEPTAEKVTGNAGTPAELEIDNSTNWNTFIGIGSVLGISVLGICSLVGFFERIRTVILKSYMID